METGGRVDAVRLNDGVFEGLDVVADVFGLLGWDDWGWRGGLFRVAVVEADFGAEGFGEGEVARGDPAAGAWVEAVDLDDVAAGDVFAGEVIGVETFDVDAVGTAFRFFHDGVDAQIVAWVVERAVVGVGKDLDEAPAGGPAADAVAELVHEGVADHAAVEVVVALEDPIGFRGHAERGDWGIFAEFVPCFDVHGVFGPAGGGGAADDHAAAGGDDGSVSEGGAVGGGGVRGEERPEHGSVCGGETASEVVDDDDGEVGGEGGGGGAEARVGLGADEAGGEAWGGFEGAGADHGGGGEGERPGVERGGAVGFGTVGGVADLGGG